MSIGNRIVDKKFDIDKSIIERLKRIPTPNIGDVMGRMMGIDPTIRHLNNVNCVGRAITVKVPNGDNLFLHKAIDDYAREDMVIVCSQIGNSDRALIGELMLSFAERRELVGVIVDGYIRDYEYIKESSNLGVFAKGACLNGPYKNGPGEINTPIAIGNQVVFPGDYIVGDDDGVVVIPQNEVIEVLEKAEKINNNEINTKNLISQNRYEKPWMNKKINEIETEIVK